MVIVVVVVVVVVVIIILIIKTGNTNYKLESLSFKSCDQYPDRNDVISSSVPSSRTHL